MRRIFSKIVLLTAAVFMVTAIISCENFLSGSDLREQVEEIIADANAKEIQLNFDEKNTGTIKASQYVLKVGRTMEFTYNIDDRYEFKSWNIYEENELTDNLVEIKEKESFQKDSTAVFTIKILKTPKYIKANGRERYAVIKIVPVCEERPVVSLNTPVLEDAGVSRDRAIFMEFTQELDRNSFIFNDDDLLPEDAELFTNDDDEIYAYRYNGETYFKNIEIKNYMNLSVVEHYKAPEIDGKILRIEIDKENPILIDAGKFDMIDVTVNKAVANKKGVCLATDFNWHFKIIEATDETATIYTEAQLINDVVTGKVPKNEEERICYINSKIPLDFTADSGFQFYRWEYDDSIVSVSDPRSASTTAYVLKTTKESDTVDNPSTIRALCKPVLTASAEIENTTVAKDTDILIVFSKNLAEENDFDRIKISSEGTKADSNYSIRNYDSSSRTLTIKNTKRFEIEKGRTKEITVSIPQDFYYTEQDGDTLLKIYMGSERDISFNIDYTTNTTNKVTYTVIDGESRNENPLAGTLSVENLTDRNWENIYLDEEREIKFTLNDGYYFEGFKYTDASGNDLTADVINVQNRNEFEKTIRFDASSDNCRIVAVCYKRPSVLQKKPDSENGPTVFENNRSIEIELSHRIEDACKDMIELSYTGGIINQNEYYNASVDGTGTKITLTQKKGKLLEIRGASETVTVKVPKEIFYYAADGKTKIENTEDVVWSFKINSDTMNKTAFVYSNDNGKIYADGSADEIISGRTYEYSENQNVSLKYVPLNGYSFEKWSISGIPEGYVTLTDTNGKYTVSYDGELYFEIENVNSAETVMHNYSAVGGTVTIIGKQFLKPTASFEPENIINGKEFDSVVKLNFNKQMNQDTLLLTETDGDGNVTLQGTVNITLDNEHIENYFVKEWDGNTLKLKPVEELSLFVPEEKSRKDIYVVLDSENILDTEGKQYKGTESFVYRINGSSNVKTSIKFIYENASLRINSDNVQPSTPTEFIYNVAKENVIEFRNNAGRNFMGWMVEVPGSTEYSVVYSANGKVSVKKDGQEYFVLEDRFSETSVFYLYKPVDNEIQLSVQNLLIPEITKSYAGNNIDNPVYTPSGYACDSEVTFVFNKNLTEDNIQLTKVNSSTGARTVDGVIDIVSLNNPNKHYEDYFSVQVDGNTIKIIPDVVVLNYSSGFYMRDKLKIKQLVPSVDDTFELKIILDTERICDEDGLSINLDVNNWIYKINGRQEELEPEIENVTLFAQKYDMETDTMGDYRQLTNVSSIPTSESIIKNIHVGKGIKVSLSAADYESGIREVKVIETLERSTSNETITNQSFEQILDCPTTKTSAISKTYYIDFSADKDGLVGLEFVVEDLAGNKKSVKRYVIKDTTVDETILVPFNFGNTFQKWKSENWVSKKVTGSSYPYTVSENKDTNYTPPDGYTKLYSEMVEPGYLTGENPVYLFNGSTTSQLTYENYMLANNEYILLDMTYINDTFFKRSSYQVYNSNYKLNVYYKYGRNSSYPAIPNAPVNVTTETLYNSTTYAAIGSVDKKYYKIPYSPKDEEVYIKIECVDEIGNKAEIERIVPGKIQITNFTKREYSTKLWLIPTYERLAEYQLQASEIGATFDILFYYTGPDYNPNKSLASNTYTVTSSSSKTTSKPRRADTYITNPFIDATVSSGILFANGSDIPKEIYMPNGKYNLYFIPYFEYPDKTKYYGKPCCYTYDWNSSSPKETAINNNWTAIDFPTSFTVDVLPAETSRGTRTIKVTLPAKNVSPVWYADTNYLYGIKYYAHEGDCLNSSLVLSTTSAQNYIPFKEDVSVNSEVTDYFELQSGYKYDICLYQKCNNNSYNNTLYLSKNAYVLNVDLTYDNVPPKVSCFATDYAYRYINYPDCVKLANFNSNYNFIPEDDGYGLYNFAYPEYMEDEDSKGDWTSREFKYYFIKKENETWTTPQISLDWLDENVASGNIKENWGSINLKYDSVNDRYISGTPEEVFADLSTKDLAEGYYTFVLRMMDNRMDPDGDFYYDEEDSHQPNEGLICIPISTKLVETKYKLIGSGSSRISAAESGYLTVDKMVSDEDGRYSWRFAKCLGLDGSYLNSSEYANSPFVRYHHKDTSKGDASYYYYVSPDYLVYKYSHPEFELISKSILKTNQGYQVFTDGPVLVQQVVSKRNLSEECPSTVNIGSYWLTKGDSKFRIQAITSDMKVFLYDSNVANWKNMSFTYTNEKKWNGYYNVTVFTFADGTSLVGDVIPPN